MKTVIYSAAVLALAAGLGGCAGKETTTDAREKLESTWAPQIGKATKAEFVEKYGDAEWCKPHEESGEETCRFYLKKGTKWLGDKKDRKHFESGDDVVADFDNTGVLKAFKAKAQR